MNLFDVTVQKALQNNQHLSSLRPVVEKEILHHDILRIMNGEEFLKKLTFIGGTCLRSCYGSPRLSEDLDFTGGFDFTKKTLSDLGSVLVAALEKKYQLKVSVSEPQKDIGNVETWKLKIITRPERPDLPAQRINIDICALPSYQRKPVVLKNNYDIGVASTGLILYAESLQEILVDKIIAIANRPNRVKNRDLWDFFWLTQRNITIETALLEQKLLDRHITRDSFKSKFSQKIDEIRNGQQDFLHEMKRFLEPAAFDNNFTDTLWWDCLIQLLSDALKSMGGRKP